LIDHYRSPFLGVNYDPSHDILSGHFDVGWMIRQWGIKRIKHIHLKDAAGIQNNGQFIFPLIGEGHVNWASFFEALREIGYQGYSSVEFESFAYLKTILNNDMAAAASMSFSKKLFRPGHLGVERRNIFKL
jgi:sugar phosphate isomerase/epimerase